MFHFLDFLRDVHFLIQALLVFVIMFAMDVAYAYYTVTASQKDALPAAAWAGSIVLCSSVATISYVQDPWMIIPAVLGAFAGTLATLRFMK